MALLSAMATLLAALFVCFGMTGRQEAPRPEPRVPFADSAVVGEYSCPYDRDDCRLFPSLSPAVLTAPPLDPPPHADGLARTAPGPGVVGATASQARPRAPDLHVLQVLRT
ncbi:hypothetical protein [Streptomyces sp. NPDC047928]|uniref:hypothetical protein n=1 Tax=unclassified Streptomyces TaxID=2593676 RepID=UPI00371FE3DF